MPWARGTGPFYSSGSPGACRTPLASSSLRPHFSTPPPPQHPEVHPQECPLLPFTRLESKMSQVSSQGPTPLPLALASCGEMQGS